jgi:hypothetical protein
MLIIFLATFALIAFAIYWTSSATPLWAMVFLGFVNCSQDCDKSGIGVEN